AARAAASLAAPGRGRGVRGPLPAAAHRAPAAPAACGVLRQKPGVHGGARAADARVRPARRPRGGARAHRGVVRRAGPAAPARVGPRRGRGGRGEGDVTTVMPPPAATAPRATVEARTGLRTVLESPGTSAAAKYRALAVGRPGLW